MEFPLRTDQWGAIADHYEREGFVILTDVDERPATLLREIVGSLSDLSPERIREVARGHEITLSPEVRNRLARPPMECHHRGAR